MLDRDHPEAIKQYIDDLREVIEYVDREIFAARKFPLARALVREERITGLRDCAHIGRYSSVLFRIPDELCVGVTPLRRDIDTYVVWQEPFQKLIAQLSKVNVTSISDSDLKKVWFLTAVALVRVRVLHHPEWFPEADRRNIRTMAKHNDIVGPEIFSLKNDFEKSRRALINLDIYLTQTLIASAIEKAMPMNEVLEYIALD